MVYLTKKLASDLKTVGSTPINTLESLNMILMVMKLQVRSNLNS